MESHGHRGSNPKAVLASLLSKREKLQDELRNVEKQVYELETSYLQETGTFGNALKGFEGFLSTSNKNANLKRSRKFQLEDRLFSLSSVTSPAMEDQILLKVESGAEVLPLTDSTWWNSRGTGHHYYKKKVLLEWIEKS
ncbi:chromatin modification-related protein EAF6-like isoform X2 [Nicotiana tabacum]|uniref:Chromatin modification-related protein EAF6-like isoform X2 n=1 Tax=Nicotiana tabacum TaxID=4097 RepID=A0AC58SKG2_TOBAC